MKLLKIAERVLRFSVNQYLGLKTINPLPKNKRSMNEWLREKTQRSHRESARENTLGARPERHNNQPAPKIAKEHWFPDRGATPFST